MSNEIGMRTRRSVRVKGDKHFTNRDVPCIVVGWIGRGKQFDGVHAAFAQPMDKVMNPCIPESEDDDE
jgi:hypothetical protein